MSEDEENMIKNERRKYCLENVEKSFKVVFENKTLELFTSVLQNTRPNTEWNVRKGFLVNSSKFDANSVIDYVLGLKGVGYERKKWDLKEGIGLFEFFSALEMRSWELSVLNTVEKCKNVEFAVLWFKRTYEKFEQPASSLSLDDISIRKNSNDNRGVHLKSPFTIALFNCLSRSIEKIRKNRSWMRVFETAGVWGDLIRWKRKNLRKEKRYLRVKTYSRFALVHVHLKLLHRNLAEFHNFIIVSADEKETRVHKEIIIMFSDYFYQIIKFGGPETRREGYLLLENLNHRELTMLVEYIYTKNFNFQEEDLIPCLNLLKELVHYPNEKEIQESLKALIVKQDTVGP